MPEGSQQRSKKVHGDSKGDIGADTDEGGTLLFCVEACDHEGKNVTEKKYFRTLEAAKAYLESAGGGYRWLCEMGYWVTGRTLATDWVYFWWSAGTTWEDPVERGHGVPHPRKTSYDYFPVDPTYDPPPWRIQRKEDLLK